MNLERLAKISEIVTGFAIVLTLAILAYEVNANTRALRHQLETARSERFHDVVDSPYIQPILAKIKAVDADKIPTPVQALMNQYELNFEEADRLTRYIAKTWNGLEADYRYGLKDPDFIRSLLAYPDQLTYWQSSHGGYDEEFRSYVERIRATAADE